MLIVAYTYVTWAVEHATWGSRSVASEVGCDREQYQNGRRTHLRSPGQLRSSKSMQMTDAPLCPKHSSAMKSINIDTDWSMYDWQVQGGSVKKGRNKNPKELKSLGVFVLNLIVNHSHNHRAKNNPAACRPIAHVVASCCLKLSETVNSFWIAVKHFLINYGLNLFK